METDEENGEEEDIVEDVVARADAAAAPQDFSGESLSPCDLTGHCRSCLRFLTRSCSVHRLEVSFFVGPCSSEGGFPWEIADAEVEEVERAGEEAVDAGELDLLDGDASVEAEDNAGEDKGVDDETATSAGWWHALRCSPVPIRSRRRFAGHLCGWMLLSRGSKPFSRDWRMRAGHGDRPSHAATADLLAVLVVVEAVIVFVHVSPAGPAPILPAGSAIGSSGWLAGDDR